GEWVLPELGIAASVAFLRISASRHSPNCYECTHATSDYVRPNIGTPAPSGNIKNNCKSARFGERARERLGSCRKLDFTKGARCESFRTQHRRDALGL